MAASTILQVVLSPAVLVFSGVKLVYLIWPRC